MFHVKQTNRRLVYVKQFTFSFCFLILFAKDYGSGLCDYNCSSSCNMLDGALPLQTSPHKGRAPCESPEKALRSQDSAAKEKNNFRIRTSREKALDNFDFSPFLRILVSQRKHLIL